MNLLPCRQFSPKTRLQNCKCDEYTTSKEIGSSLKWFHKNLPTCKFQKMKQQINFVSKQQFNMTSTL